jgi:hypothetical protein
VNDKVQPTPPLQVSERDKWNYDVGFERGWGERNSELLDAFESALENAINALRTAVAEMSAD